MSTTLAPAAQQAFGDNVATMRDVVLSPTSSGARPSLVTFEVGARSRLFVVGPPGSGKSALLDLLSFRRRPSGGHMEVLGVDPTRIAPLERPRIRGRLGQLIWDQSLLPELSVFANVALGAKIARRHPRDYTPDVRELLVWVGLGGRGADRISRLSESEKRRLCLARALVNRPELLLVDDPTLGLGEKAARGIMRLIEDVNEAGTPIIFATRDRGLAVSAGGLIYDMPAREAR